MFRRSVLKAATASVGLLGLGTLARAQRSDDAPTGPGAAPAHPRYPFPVVTVRGSDALAEWRR
jgi:hypothetical protein